MVDIKVERPNKKDILRVALDSKATSSYEKMIGRLKENNPWVRFYPSEFISFLVSDYFETHFENDLEILTAAFFDSHGFINSETQRAKNSANFEDAMREALEKAEKIRSKVRRKPKVKIMRDNNQLNESSASEKI